MGNPEHYEQQDDQDAYDISNTLRKRESIFLRLCLCMSGKPILSLFCLVQYDFISGEWVSQDFGNKRYLSFTGVRNNKDHRIKSYCKVVKRKENEIFWS